MKLLSLLFIPIIYYNSNNNNDYLKESTKKSLKRLQYLLSPNIYYRKNCKTDNECLKNEKCCYTKYKNFCCSNSEFIYYALNSLN